MLKSIDSIKCFAFLPEKNGMNPRKKRRKKKIGKRSKKVPVYFQTIYVIHSASVCASTCHKKTDRQTRNSDLFDFVFLTKKEINCFPSD